MRGSTPETWRIGHKPSGPAVVLVDSRDMLRNSISVVVEGVVRSDLFSNCTEGGMASFDKSYLAWILDWDVHQAETCYL